MKIVACFELGSYSTKVSYFTDDTSKNIQTNEYKNIVLFQTANKILIGS